MSGRFLLEPPAAVYIHIPFCVGKCPYCDFNSYELEGQPVADYLDALEREVELTVKQTPPAVTETIFIGGGTPTVLTPAQLQRLFSIIDTYFPQRSPRLEFTMEANPGTLTPDKLLAMVGGGVNRISLGAQAFDDGLLAAIGRTHRSEDVYRCLEQARAAGIGNLSIDLMFGLPGQSPQMLEDTLSHALALDLQHYSIYGLKVEENTPFHAMLTNNQLDLPEEETEARMFERIMERLEQKGYRQYEISNFARPGYESRHNSMYWRNKAYYGFGAGAHGYTSAPRHVDAPAAAGRHMNIPGVAAYISAAASGLLPRQERHPVSREEAMEDFMMVGLRLLEGVREADFLAQFGVPVTEPFGSVLEKLIGDGWLQRTDSGYKLSSRVIPVANLVFAEFVGHLS